jgi:hypothetical protein
LSLVSVISASVFFAGCNSTAVSSKAQADSNVEKVDYFADNALKSALAVVQHPAGIHKDGITYVSYQGPKEDPPASLILTSYFIASE